MPVERLATIAGTGLPVRGDNIDTDRIIPARYLRSISFEGLEQHLFADDRAQADAVTAHRHPLSDPRFKGASILIVNANFGCGSSREHAPQAIRRWGIKAIIGQSFSEIFFGNSVALGMPCVTAGAEDIELLMRTVEENPLTAIRLDLERRSIAFESQGPNADPSTSSGSSRATSRDERRAPGDHLVPITIPAAARDAFLDGSWDATGLLLDRYAEVEAVAARLPYVNAWTRP